MCEGKTEDTRIMEGVAVVQSHREMAHVLGLRDHPSFFAPSNEGYLTRLACRSSRRRFARLTDGGTLRIRAVDDVSSHAIVEALQALTHGDYASYIADWCHLSPFSRENFGTGHCITFHMVRDNHQVHFVYVNRGEPADSLACFEEQRRVRVYTVDIKKADAFAKIMARAFQSGFKAIGRFLVNNHHEINEEATFSLAKSPQKVGNCSFANTNISWHIALASTLMKNNPQKHFVEAMLESRPQYHALRMLDRVHAIAWMLEHPAHFASSRFFRYNYFQALQHIGHKKPVSADAHIHALIDHTERRGLLQALTRPLLHADVFKRLQSSMRMTSKASHQSLKETFLTVLSTIDALLASALPKLSLIEQTWLASHDPRLLHYMDAAVQQHLTQIDVRFRFYTIALIPVFPLAATPSYRMEATPATRIRDYLWALRTLAVAERHQEFHDTLTRLCFFCADRHTGLFGRRYILNRRNVTLLLHALFDPAEDYQPVIAQLQFTHPKELVAYIHATLARENPERRRSAYNRACVAAF
ncbi:hypothetical protein Lgee_0288 [Legionella geestiana]|uniref:Uncharacterized protein n=1 Tax=Legionella geestiana TaxID=45065 RepID=A0A0W0U8N1_9GAMM|nr:hypothetical protein [Legionella geestiana]KTD04045.1 hypothetical protein Lgee_0288 [Legionella geestiana]QBS12060.1 hypothetical protein E4T54_04505 [Legionella geestiana]STX53220.1 Uncharacterised protein [Legionella geestiana]